MSPREEEGGESFIKFVKDEVRSELNSVQVFTPIIINEKNKSHSCNVIQLDLTPPDDRPIAYEPHWYPRNFSLAELITRPSDDESEDSMIEESDYSMIAEYDSDENDQETFSENEESNTNEPENSDVNVEVQNNQADEVEIIYESINLDNDPLEKIDVESGELEITSVS